MEVKGYSGKTLSLSFKEKLAVFGATRAQRQTVIDAVYSALGEDAFSIFCRKNWFLKFVCGWHYTADINRAKLFTGVSDRSQAQRETHPRTMSDPLPHSSAQIAILGRKKATSDVGAWEQCRQHTPGSSRMLRALDWLGKGLQGAEYEGHLVHGGETTQLFEVFDPSVLGEVVGPRHH